MAISFYFLAQEALKSVQPSSKREGFATVPGITWEDVGALEEVREELTMAILVSGWSLVSIVLKFVTLFTKDCLSVRLLACLYCCGISVSKLFVAVIERFCFALNGCLVS